MQYYPLTTSARTAVVKLVTTLQRLGQVRLLLAAPNGRRPAKTGLNDFPDRGRK